MIDRNSMIAFGFVGLGIYLAFRGKGGGELLSENPVFSDAIDLEDQSFDVTSSNPVPMVSMVNRIKAKINRIGFDKFKRDMLLNKLNLVAELFPNAPQAKQEKLMNIFLEVMRESAAAPTRNINQSN